MANRIITLEIPEELAADAEQLGSLSRDRLITWLQAEITRQHPVTGDEPAANDSARHESLRRLQEAAVRLRALEPALTLDEIEDDIRAALNET